MSDGSDVQWLRGPGGRHGATWNWAIGCDPVSPGCGLPRFGGDDTGGCYAIVQAHIGAGNPNPKVAAAFAGLTVRTLAGLAWTGQLNLLPERICQPPYWRTGRRIFANSLSGLAGGPMILGGHQRREGGAR